MDTHLGCRNETVWPTGSLQTGPSAGSEMRWSRIGELGGLNPSHVGGRDLQVPLSEGPSHDFISSPIKFYLPIAWEDVFSARCSSRARGGWGEDRCQVRCHGLGPTQCKVPCGKTPAGCSTDASEMSPCPPWSLSSTPSVGPAPLPAPQFI